NEPGVEVARERSTQIDRDPGPLAALLAHERGVAGEERDAELALRREHARGLLLRRRRRRARAGREEDRGEQSEGAHRLRPAAVRRAHCGRNWNASVYSSIRGV